MRTSCMKMILNLPRESGTEYAGAYVCVLMDIVRDVRLALTYSADEFEQLDNAVSQWMNYILVDRVGHIKLLPVIPPLLVILPPSFNKFCSW
jgi:hypothetical protein